MNKDNLDALFTGLTGTVQPSSSDERPSSQASTTKGTAESARRAEEDTTEERFCTIVQSVILRKIRIIAKRERLQIKDVVNAAFEKAVKSYERKHGPVDGAMKGDASNLF